MLRSVFTKDLWDRRRSMIWWVIGMGALTGWLAAFYPVLRDSEAMTDFINDFPPELLALFGIDPATFLTGAGYVQTEMYSFVAPIIVIAFTVSAGVAATSREESTGTMDMLLSNPIRRSTVVLQKADSLALLSFVIVLIPALTLMILNTPLDLKLSTGGILAISFGLWLLGMVFGGITLLVGAFSGNPTVAGGAGAAVAVLAWVVAAFSQLFTWLEIPAKLSPFTWYLHDLPLLNGMSTGHLWLILLAAFVLAAATVLFVRRNIATEQAVLPERAKARKKSTSVSPRATALLRSPFGKSLWDRRVSIWVWSLGLGTILFATFAAWPAIAGDADAMAGVVEAFPKELLAMFGLTDPSSLATPEGFVSSRTYGSVGPIVLIVFTMTAMTALVGREESTGRLDLVLSSTVPRRRLLVEKAAAVGLLTLVFAAVLFLIGMASNVLYDTEVSLFNMLASNVGLALLGLCFWGIAVALWSIVPPGTAVGVTSAIGVVAWFLNGLGSFIDVLAPFRWISPFYWYLGDVVALDKGFTFGYLALGAVALAGTAFAVLRFRTRDLAV